MSEYISDSWPKGLFASGSQAAVSHSCGGTGAWEDIQTGNKCLHPCKPTEPHLHPGERTQLFHPGTECTEREREVTPLRREIEF